ncbi:MAG: AAA family ATPase [Cytophagales bacterium]|nr:AAA family ATPase [Cytophagales bacterium]
MKSETKSGKPDPRNQRYENKNGKTEARSATYREVNAGHRTSYTELPASNPATHAPFPFTAIVGQEKMKKALLLNMINPKIGGVLIKGEKGTAKSTMVRALSEVFPDREVVELPIGATEDKVSGTLDIEHAIKHGEKKFEPGVLARADKHILYVDEVNLLEDHIVDLLLDVAAMGVNVVEREGISHAHPSRFVLIGTMNPEEGDLRPQLLDRFGLTADVSGEQSIELRTEIIKRRLAFEADAEAFARQFEPQQKELAEQVRKARELLPDVAIDEKLYELIAYISTTLGVDGHRADIIMVKTAVTLTAWHGRKDVDTDGIYEAAELVLPHRMRRLPFDESEFCAEKLKAIIEQKEVPNNQGLRRGLS